MVLIKSKMKEELKVRKEYLKKLEKIRKGEHIRIGSIKNFEKRYELE